jgi:protein TonB
MEIKKSPSADLENKRLSFVFIGLVIVLALVYITLEWTQRDVAVYDASVIVDAQVDDEIIPVTIQDQTPPPPPEIAPPPPVVVDIQIVENTENVGDNTVASSESNQNVVIQPQAPVIIAPIEDDPDERTVFVIVEKMPSFPGGDAEMRKFISKNIRYPKISEENGVEGRVVVSFVVGRTGEITDIEIMKSVDKYLDAEAMRVVSAMPKWTPGEQRGKAVKVKYVLPVVFKL